MRYFLELAYLGTRYVGWQNQRNGVSVQQAIEQALAILLREPVEITGCGRTDAGVHASQFFAHFDFAEEFPKDFLSRLNKILPPDIAIRQILEVGPEAHARFDAIERSYAYHIVFSKNPFRTEQAFHFPFSKKLDFSAMHKAAALLLEFGQFAPFCKSRTDALTMDCTLHRSEWEIGPDGMVYHIIANRFLRGMVRLIVGMCLNVGLGNSTLPEVREALETQTLMKTSYSVPPQGLFLTTVRYPFLK